MALLGSLVSTGDGRAEDAQQSFDTAVKTELYGGRAASMAAFALYLRAARGGLPEAQFNAGIFLDSGRGGIHDLSLAASWYARAAAHGHSRAAFNLGQLYEAGDGVPRNADLARSWFTASALPAALARAKRMTFVRSPPSLTSAELVAPKAGEAVVSDTGFTEFVWVSEQQPGPAQFLLEVCAIRDGKAKQIFSGTTNVSSLAVLLPRGEPRLAWRIISIVPASGSYAVAKWIYFSSGDQPSLALQGSAAEPSGLSTR
ncbi:tetratricopeptide repeat protein [Lichenihabitans sp. Uapishka_5]|uniref:tetratricopeptide repeat protein n=1 Tax=Lichenihabitans sp. Uapishka_5 TaxID=3037302 RepID=UPI0029E7D1C1|nr:hypothetical protein [Lichenihabitans sp. Uapishka_5]